MLGRPRRILVEIRWRLGDEIMALPIYEALRRRYPEARLTVWASHPELLEGNPHIDVVNDDNVDPDRYVYLREGPQQTSRLAHYARRAGVPVSEIRPRIYYQDWSTAHLGDDDRPYVAIATGATWPTKQWPAKRWLALAGLIEEAGFAVVELGRDHDPVGSGLSLVNQTSVRDVAKVLRKCRLLVSGDCGLMHLAVAVETPVVALFGPTDPSILMGDEPKLRIITNERDCQGCWNKNHAAKEPGICPLNIDMCLGTITPETVIEHVRELASRER
jgi:ADP-heptose:LPS heptosyltransferase